MIIIITMYLRALQPTYGVERPKLYVSIGMRRRTD
nr:MAG TPA: hypothetical protein [Caudoviricetes sp.]